MSIPKKYRLGLNSTPAEALPEPTEEELVKFEEYNSDCEIISDLESPLMVENNDHFRSQITSSHLFRKTAEGGTLKIYSYGFRKNLVPDRFGYMTNLERCLLRCAKAEIIIDGVYDSNVVRMIAKVANTRPENISIYLASNTLKDHLNFKLKQIQEKEIVKKFQIENTHYHFTISDNTRYRLEYEPNEKLAKVYYNDIEEATDLSAIFDEIIQNSKLSKKISITVD